MRMILLAALIAIIGGCASPAEDMDLGEFTGRWEVDLDRTLEFSKQSPKYDEDMDEKTLAMLKHLMSRMKIRVTESELIYLGGNQEKAFPIFLKEADAGSVAVAMRQGSEEFRVVFTFVEAGFMNFRSDGSDDMDYYIWKRVEDQGS